MRSRRTWWLAYGGAAAAVLVALGWVTVMVVQLERAWLAARADAGHQESLRLALWRMDSWLAAMLAQEAARPYFTYESFYEQPAFVNGGTPAEQAAVLTPSPLLAFQSDYLQLHFQIAPDGSITSPQVPVGDYQTLASDNALLPQQQLLMNAQTFESLDEVVNPRQVEQCVAAFEAQPEPAPPAQVLNPPLQQAQIAQGPAEYNDAQRLWTQREASSRKGSYLKGQKRQADGTPRTGAGAPAEPSSGGSVGAFVSFWSDADETRPSELIFARAVRVAGQDLYQGFLCNWPRLRAELLSEIADLFPQGTLLAVRGTPAEDVAGTMLATIPVRLDVPAPAVAAAPLMSLARGTVLLAWIAVVIGIVAVAVTLRASIAFGEKRSRFASAVTHELRTPLTTFQMYSEMLAEGMVDDPEKRQVYLETLKDESARLAGLVENVLAYARLEDGRRPAERVKTTLGDVLDRAVPPLRKRAEAAGMTLVVDVREPARDAPLHVDPEAVGQVLYNLVDNACKYAGGSDDPTVHVEATTTDGRVTVAVRDHGPGVSPEHARAIFAPFERGKRDPTDPIPGVGLGLALARGLAADLGGSLDLAAADTGARFELTLPKS